MPQPNAHLFKFCPACGKRRLRPADRKSFLCPVCGFRFYLNSAAAAIGLIFNKDGKICVTRRKNRPAEGLLDFPGGFADPGETIESCIIREIKEELNLSVSSLKYLFSHPNIYKYGRIAYDITDFVFFCRTDTMDGIQARDDVEEFIFEDIRLLKREAFGLNSAKTIVDWLKTDKARAVLSSLKN